MLNMLLGERRMDGSSGPLSSFWYNPAARKSASGVSVTPTSAMTMAAVWCATKYLCGVIGSLPLNYYQSVDGKRILLADDPVQRLIHSRPNPHLRPSTFKSLLTKWQVNWGNAYAEIQWMNAATREEPFALWPIHPSRVRPVVNQDDVLLFEVNPADSAEKPTYIEMESMIHIPNVVMSDDGMTGLGVYQQARETIGGGLAAEEEANRTFSTGRMPKVVVESQGKPTAEARQNFRREWREIHTDERHDVALLVEGMTAKVLSQNLKDSQFIELRQFIIEEVSRWYGLPPQKLQQLLHTSYNSAEQLNSEVVSDTLIPQAKPWEEELEWKLTPERFRAARSIRFAFQGLLRGDTNARGQFYRTLAGIGVLNRNEIRELEDYNPVDGGDTFLTQGANVALNDEGEPEPPAAAQTPAVDTETDDANQSSRIVAELSRQAAALDSTRDTLKATARGLFAATLARMVYIESTAAKRASKKPQQFIGWLDEFYGEHQGTMSDALGPVFTACIPFGVADDPKRWSAGVCEQSRTRLLDVAGECTPDKLADAVSALMGEWETSRASDIVAGIAELN